MTPFAPALLVALAVHLGLGSGSPSRLRRLTSAEASERPDAVLLAGAAVATLTLGPVVALALLALAYGVRAALRRHAAVRAAREVAAALPEVCRAAAAEIRAGAPPPAALERAAEDAPPALRDHLVRLAADPAPPDEWAALSGAERLRAVAALWNVVASAGAGLADGLDRLAESLAAEQRQAAEVSAQLAGPKATAAVLAALPLCGIALAAALGARPVAFLLGTPIGLACLAAGAALDAAGLWWVRRLTALASA